jgi:hypothetical protein
VSDYRALLAENAKLKADNAVLHQMLVYARDHNNDMDENFKALQQHYEGHSDL